MYRANMHEAKNKLSQLVEMVLAGEEVIITNAGKPIAKLIAYQEAQEEQQERVLGALDLLHESMFAHLYVNRKDGYQNIIYMVIWMNG